MKILEKKAKVFILGDYGLGMMLVDEKWCGGSELNNIKSQGKDSTLWLRNFKERSF